MTSNATTTATTSTVTEQDIEQAVDMLTEALVTNHSILITGDVKRGVRFYTSPTNCKGRHMGASIADPSRANVGSFVVDLRSSGYTMKAIAKEVGLSVSTCRRLINEYILSTEVHDMLAEGDAVLTTAVAA